MGSFCNRQWSDRPAPSCYFAVHGFPYNPIAHSYTHNVHLIFLPFCGLSDRVYRTAFGVNIGAHAFRAQARPAFVSLNLACGPYWANVVVIFVLERLVPCQWRVPRTEPVPASSLPEKPAPRTRSRARVCWAQDGTVCPRLMLRPSSTKEGPPGVAVASGTSARGLVQPAGAIIIIRSRERFNTCRPSAAGSKHRNLQFNLVF